MTTTTDDDAVERAFEALLAGRPVPPSAEGLMAFAGGVRAVAERPGRPSAALAELLSTGLLADRSSPSTRTAPIPESAALHAAVPARRRRTRMLLPALLAKLASLGAVAKAATVTGVVVAGFTTAGFTGALPTPVQHDFATVVSNVTPLQAPDPTSTAPAGTAPATTDPAATTPAATTTADPSGTEDRSGTADQTKAEDPAGDSSHPDNFGGTVSGMAHESDGTPGVDGGAVSSLAREREQERHGGTDAATATPARTTDTPERSTSAKHSSGSDGSDGSDSGSGSGHGHGSD